MAKQPDEERRARENAALIERWRRGETLSLVPPAATWWPPRPIIKKDPAAIATLYGIKPMTYADLVKAAAKEEPT